MVYFSHSPQRRIADLAGTTKIPYSQWFRCFLKRLAPSTGVARGSNAQNLARWTQTVFHTQFIIKLVIFRLQRCVLYSTRQSSLWLLSNAADLHIQWAAPAHQTRPNSRSKKRKSQQLRISTGFARKRSQRRIEEFRNKNVQRNYDVWKDIRKYGKTPSKKKKNRG